MTSRVAVSEIVLHFLIMREDMFHEVRKIDIERKRALRLAKERRNPNYSIYLFWDPFAQE